MQSEQPDRAGAGRIPDRHSAGEKSMIENKNVEMRQLASDNSIAREEEVRYDVVQELLGMVRYGNAAKAERFFYDNIKVLFPEEDHFLTALRASEYAAAAAEQAVLDGIRGQVLIQALSDMRKRIRKIQTAREAREQCVFTVRKIAELTRTVRDVRKDYNGQYSPAVLACMDSIISHMPEKRLVTDLADDVHLSPKYLSALFARETGKTISEFEQELSVREAKFLLQNTDFAYSDISYMLNYSSQSYFNAVFRKETGMTPSQYRRMHRK